MITKEEIKKELEILWPLFEKNCDTWVNQKFYRLTNRYALKDLANFLNKVDGENKYQCHDCNVGALLTRLDQIHTQYADPIVIEPEEIIIPIETTTVVTPVKPVIKPTTKKK